jgi:hypothetical protein
MPQATLIPCRPHRRTPVPSQQTACGCVRSRHTIPGAANAHQPAALTSTTSKQHNLTKGQPHLGHVYAGRTGTHSTTMLPVMQCRGAVHFYDKCTHYMHDQEVHVSNPLQHHLQLWCPLMVATAHCPQKNPTCTNEKVRPRLRAPGATMYSHQQWAR